MNATVSPATRNFGIDCLRGLAIVLVVVHHLALPFRLPLGPSLLGNWLPKRLINAISFSGYEAVFVFFVISGFLIARRIIARDGALQHVQPGQFYRARAWRILPLLLAILAVLTLLAMLDVPGFGPDPARQSIPGLLRSALSLTFNWYEGRTGWAPAGWDILWSLSIEEAFYLGFPLLCLVLPRRVLLACCWSGPRCWDRCMTWCPPPTKSGAKKPTCPGWPPSPGVSWRRWSARTGRCQRALRGC